MAGGDQEGYGSGQERTVNEADIPELTEWVSLSQVAQRLNTSRQNVHKMLRAGRFRTVRRIALSKGYMYVVSDTEVEEVEAKRNSRTGR